MVKRVFSIIILVMLMAACGGGTDATPTPPSFDDITTAVPQDAPEGGTEGDTAPTPATGGGAEGDTIPPTNTPASGEDQSGQIVAITLEGSDFRTQEAITVRVQVGSSVSQLECFADLQGTETSVNLGTPARSSISETLDVASYTFTPEESGTYVISCSGVALTLDGEVPASQTSTSFVVEAKG